MMVPTTTKTTTTTTTTTMTTMTTTRTTTTTTRTRTRTRTRRRRRTRSNNNNDDNNDNDDDDNDDDDNEDAARSMSCPQVQMKSPSLFPSPDPYRHRRCAKLYNITRQKKTSRKCSNLLSEAKSSKLAKLLMINGKSHAARASHGHLPASTSKASEPSAELPGAACVSRGFRRPNCHLLFTLW